MRQKRRAGRTETETDGKRLGLDRRKEIKDFKIRSDEKRENIERLGQMKD